MAVAEVGAQPLLQKQTPRVPDLLDLLAELMKMQCHTTLQASGEGNVISSGP